VPVFQRFYKTAQTRDEVLVKRALAKIAELREPCAVLITGGFHAPRINQLLREQGAGVITIAPKVSHAPNEQLYHAVLKYKSGRIPLAEVEAIANGSIRGVAHEAH